MKSPISFTLDLSQVDYQVPNLLAGKTGMLVSPAAIAKNAAGLPTHPVGDGPFTLTTYVPDSHADLVRNPGYWNASEIHAGQVPVKSITEPQQILAALQSGQVNVAVIAGSQVAAAKAPASRSTRSRREVVNTLDIKTTTKAPFNNPRWSRRSTTRSTARPSSQVQEFGHGTPSYQPFPKGYVGYDPAWPTCTRTTRPRPSQLLAEAGYPHGMQHHADHVHGTETRWPSSCSASSRRPASRSRSRTCRPTPVHPVRLRGQDHPRFALDGTAGRELAAADAGRALQPSRA